MFVLVNAVALTFICYAYLRMINEIKASGVACRSTRQSQDREKVAQRFGIIVLTDSLCWVPVIIVKLVALAGHPIPPDLYAWLAIFILPINSALNPVLYTLTTTVFKKQVWNCVYKNHLFCTKLIFRCANSLIVALTDIVGANRPHIRPQNRVSVSVSVCFR